MCIKHGGSAPQVREAANRRLAAATDRLMAALLDIALDTSQPVLARLTAIKDGLDRAGVGKDRPITVEIKRWERDLDGLFVDVARTDEVIDAEVVEDKPLPLPPPTPAHNASGPRPPRYGRT